MSKKEISVYLIDDSPNEEEGLRNRLRTAGVADIEILESTGNVDSDVEEVCRRKPDVVVIDYKFGPGPWKLLEGITAFERIQEEWKDVRALLYTNFVEGPVLVRAIRAGFRGYLGKRSSPEKFAESIRKVSRGDRGVFDVDLTREYMKAHAETEPVLHEVLTPKRLEVADLVGSEGLNPVQIGEILGIATETVQTHIENIYKDIDLSGDEATSPRVMLAILVQRWIAAYPHKAQEVQARIRRSIDDRPEPGERKNRGGK